MTLKPTRESLDEAAKAGKYATWSLASDICEPDSRMRMSITAHALILDKLHGRKAVDPLLIEAREIVKATLKPDDHKACNCRLNIDAGEWDGGQKVRASLAALRRGMALATPVAVDGEVYSKIGAAYLATEYPRSLRDTVNKHGYIICAKPESNQP